MRAPVSPIGFFIITRLDLAQMAAIWHVDVFETSHVIGHMKIQELSKLAVAIFVACLSQSAVAQAQAFAGRWEHRFPGDDEGEILVLRIEQDVFKGDYFGVEREGEHGLFYSAAEVNNLVVGNNEIRFVLPGRDFFTKRPKSVAQAKAWAKNSAGGSGVDLQFQGRLVGGRLELSCTAKYGGCPDTQMTFQKR